MAKCTSKSKPETKRAQCGICGGSRHCDILGHHEQSGGDDVIQWSKDWYILRCRGCDHVFAQTVYTDSESINHYWDEYGEDQYDNIETVNYWPALTKRKEPVWLVHLSGRSDDRAALRDALQELYGALEGDLHTLASIGIRTSFDIAAEILGIDASLNFARKLDELVNAGHIAALDRSRLETLVEAGSASAHRGWRPSAQQVGVMTDVLEHFIYTAFVAPEEKRALDNKIAEMGGKVPRRQKSSTKAARLKSSGLSEEEENTSSEG